MVQNSAQKHHLQKNSVSKIQGDAQTNYLQNIKLLHDFRIFYLFFEQIKTFKNITVLKRKKNSNKKRKNRIIRFLNI